MDQLPNVSAGLSANNMPITNVGIPVNRGDVVNKSYLDANGVRFLAAVQQVSVGDANGTAAMINLRGQSTCCGPTVGFADFKVLFALRVRRRSRRTRSNISH
jgi:hypothetical protein